MLVLNIAAEGEGKTYETRERTVPYLQSFFDERRGLVLYDTVGSPDDKMYESYRAKFPDDDILYILPPNDMPHFFRGNDFVNGEMGAHPFLVSMSKASNAIVVIDEGTSVFEDYDVKIRDVKKFSAITTKFRHTKTSWVINFHTISDVPISIMKRARYINLFKTYDKKKSLQGMYAEGEPIREAYDILLENAEKHSMVNIDGIKNEISLYVGKNRSVPDMVVGQ